MTLIRDAVLTDTVRLVELLSLGVSRPGKEDASDLTGYHEALEEIGRSPHNRVLVAGAHRFYERAGFLAAHEGYKLQLR